MPTTSPLALRQQQAEAQYIGPTVLLPVDGGSHATDGSMGNPAPLAVGARYLILCPDAPILIRQGGAGLTLDPDDAEYLDQGAIRIVNTTDTTNNRIAVSAAVGLAGTARITRIDSIDGVARGTPALHDAQFWTSLIGPTVKGTIGGAAIALAGLTHGARYQLVSPDDDCYVRQGASGSVTATNLDMLLPRGVRFLVTVDDAATDAISVLGRNGFAGFVRATRLDAVS